jgi:hypothetical protein
MPLEPFSGFIGGDNNRTPRFLDTEICQNLYYEAPAPGANPRSPGSLLSTPGLQSRGNLSLSEIGPIYGLVTVSGAVANNVIPDPRTFVVVGRGSSNYKLYELRPVGPPIDRGVLPFGFGFSSRIRMIPGNTALLMLSSQVPSKYGAFFGYIDTTATTLSPDASTAPGILTGNTLFNIPGWRTAIDGDFMDGYYLCIQPGSENIFISNYQDVLTWNALDFTVANDLPDSLVALRVVGARVWVFGRQRMIAFYNSGAAAFPFSRDTSARLDVGAVNATSVTTLGDTLFWLGRDPNGGVQAYKLNGYQPQRISGPSQEQAWQNYTTVDDAYAWAYQEEGHQFYVVTFPTGGPTWVYDDTTGLWHTRIGQWAGALSTYAGNTHTYNPLLGGHIVGDQGAPNCYVMSRQYTTDFGNSIPRRRTAPHLFGNGSRNFYNRFLLDTNTTQAKLSYSNDYGVTFTTPRFADIGNADRSEWCRLGSARTDRVFDVQINDDTNPVVISGAYLDVGAGL